MKLLLVEDNTRLASALMRGLREDGFDVVRAKSGREAARAFLEDSIAAGVLDLGLPDIDGLAVLREARARAVSAPILILTARDAVSARVEGLEAGADDYLVKPFAYPELLARLRALIRRTSASRDVDPPLADLVLDAKAFEVTIAGRAIALSPREHALLELLARRRGEVLGRGEILRAVFGYEFDPGTNIVDVHIAHLRRKLGASAELLQTIRGAGYRLRHRDPPHASAPLTRFE